MNPVSQDHGNGVWSESSFTEEDQREIDANLSGYFDLLVKWDKEERSKIQSAESEVLS